MFFTVEILQKSVVVQVIRIYHKGHTLGKIFVGCDDFLTEKAQYFLMLVVFLIPDLWRGDLEVCEKAIRN